MSARRDRWRAFRELVDTSPPLTDAQFRALAEQLRTEPDAWLRRSSVVHLARSERELLSDAQLGELGAMFDGKLATFIRGSLIARRLRRDPDDPQALRDARAFGQAWLTRRLPA